MPIGTAILGAIIGAIIGVFLGEPFRNSRGQYRTHTAGFPIWIFHAIVGGIAGFVLAPITLALILVHSWLIIPGTLVLYLLYKNEVDPR